MDKRLKLFALLGTAVLPFAASARADDVVLLEKGFIEKLNTADGVLTGRRAIKGAHLDTIFALDTRPSTGELYGLGNGALHKIDAGSGWATQVGAEFFPRHADWTGARLEFHPGGALAYIVVNGPEVTGFPNDLMRVEPDTGTLLDRSPEEHLTLTYAAADAGAGMPLRNISITHTASIPGGAEGELFGVDVARGMLFRVVWPGGIAFSGAPVASSIGQLGLPTTGAHREKVPFKIQPDGTALLTYRHGSLVGLYSVDLATGARTLITDTAEDREVLDLTSAPTVPSQTVSELSVSSTVMKIRLAKKGICATFEVRGQLPVPPSGWKDKLVRVFFADPADVTHSLNADHVLDARGRARTFNRSFAVGRAKDGVAPFVLRYARNWVPKFSIDSETPSQPIQLAFELLVDGKPFGTVLALDYVRGRKAGVAKLAP